ncbi:MAG: hypothetical protein PHF29_04900 [Candidatus Riflebacteria bacterium]|nr:hypothetical protein [Candidatus Riflebacteria bacterium]
MDTKINKTGFVKARVFALILLILSCSLVLSSYRSLRREFNGTLFKKESIDSFMTTDYLLYLIPVTRLSRSEEIISLLSEQKQTLHKVGVSAMVYEAANDLERIEKASFSVFIKVGDDKYFDKGLFWLIWAILGIACSFLMYFQTLKPGTNIDYDDEEIHVPGMD